MPIAPFENPDSSNLPSLPPKAAEIIRKIQTGQILGASLSIRLINEAFCIQVDESPEDSGKILASQVRLWADHLVATRGALSPAVGNAIEIVLNGLEESAASDRVEDVQAFLHAKTGMYNRRSVEQVRKIAEYGANLLPDGGTVLAYDYSSSVNAVLIRAAKDGKRLHIIIPESRSLNGGLPILRDLLPHYEQITFTVDVAIGNELKQCDAVLVGAESLTANGGFWTTVGTASIAILAKYYRVPFYVPTEIIKFDPRSIQGVSRKSRRVKLPMFDFQDLAPLPERVRVECDDLEFTPRDLITAYITEEGILPPESILTAFKRMMGGPIYKEKQ
jgi:ribose 1,5-bisphosphate isomerase